MAWQRCSAYADVWEGVVLPVWVGDQSVALYNLRGTVYATSNVCTHEDAWLSEGYLDGDCIECPLHAALYHVPTGEVRAGPVSVPLRTYPIRIEGGGVFIDIEAEGAQSDLPPGCAAQRSK